MTVEEHLVLVATLKGVKPEYMEAEINKRVVEFGLP